MEPIPAPAMQGDIPSIASLPSIVEWDYQGGGEESFVLEPAPGEMVIRERIVRGRIDQVEVVDNRWVRPTIRIFEPKARVFFDTGWEAPGKLDIFHDGSLSPSINFIEISWAHKYWEPFEGYRLGREEWTLGPVIGFGLSSLPGDSGDGTAQSSGAPVLMLSAGLQFDFPFSNIDSPYAPTAGLEVGYAVGISSDESLDYVADGAIYVGVSLHIWPTPDAERNRQKAPAFYGP
ncbi:hypothetical protein [Lignipirellula cremea]|nr:hypothetical protein [Lignipirellula cremea]